MQENLKIQVEQQQQIINYLQDKYKQSTGHELKLPQTWSQFLDVDESKAPIMNTNAEFQQNQKDNQDDGSDNEYQIEKEEKQLTFLQAVINLDLPIRQSMKQETKKPGGSMQNKKKTTLTTNFNPSNKNHMREIIDLSDFQNKNFNKPAFKEFLGNITDMRCLNSLILKNNGIDDSFLEELDILFNNTKIKRIDLSGNNIGKKGGQHIAKLLKDSITHIEWIDLSRNNFGTDVQTLTQFTQGLKKQTGLYHFCINSNTYQLNNILNEDVLQKLVASEQIFKFVKDNQNLQSFGLIDSKITQKSMQMLAQYLSTSQCTLTGLNFQYCFLSLKHIFDLGKGLQRNRSLIKLDLSCNALEPLSGIYISKAIKENVFIADINLSKNLLNNEFATHLADTLKINSTLFKCELHGNPIGEKGAQALLTALNEDNDTIESFGDINATNTNMGVLNIQLIKKALRVNSVSKDVKSKLIEQQINTISDDPRDINIKQTQFEQNQAAYENEFDDYKILKPILFTNQPYKDPSQFQIWNV